MPIRESLTDTSEEKACRSFRFGDVAELMMVETRLLARDRELSYEQQLEWEGEVPKVAPFREMLNDPSRQMMGAWQEKWLADAMHRSVQRGTAWQLLGNQVVMARICAPDIRTLMGEEAWDRMVGGLPGSSSKARVERNQTFSAFDIPSNLDSWDGYPAARQRFYDAVKAADARMIVLSGDSHMFWANELHGKDDISPVAVELATTSITSLSYGDALPEAPIGEAFVQRNPEVIFNDPGAKGYVLLRIGKDRAEADFVTVSTVRKEDYSREEIRKFAIGKDGKAGIGHLQTL
jgi:alkaline phosphatase D